MATTEEVANLRRMVAEPTEATYSNLALSAILDAAPSAYHAAASIWQEKAGTYAELVNTSESGSSRSNSQLHQNALNMAKHYRDLANPVVTTASSSPTSYPIERA